MPLPNQFQLSLLLQDLLEAYQHWANETKRAVTFQVDQEFSVVTDPRYLRQLLHNLLTNAIKHGTGSLHLRLCRSGSLVSCVITNEVALPSREQRGIGLGLRVSKAIAATLCCTVKAGVQGGLYRAEISWGEGSPDVALKEG